MQTQQRRISRAFSIAVAAVVGGLLPLTALAQNQVQNGNARDANNRIGSGGSNGGGSAGAPGSPYSQPRAYTGVQSINNAIVSGNVTGGREFRGSAAPDPFAFRGGAAGGGVDRFVRESSGVTTGGQTSFNASRSTQFYGAGRAVAPPAGFAESGATGGYTPINTSMSRSAGDLRMGTQSGSSEYGAPLPGQLLLPGPVDSDVSGAGGYLSASPLLGVRQGNPRDIAMSSAAGGDPTAAASALRQSLSTGRAVDSAVINRLRDELLLNNEPLDRTSNSNANGVNATDTPDMNRQLPKPFESPENQPLNGGVRQGDPTGGQNQSGTLSNDALSNNVVSSARMRSRSLLVPAERVTPQYAELQRRLERYKSNAPGQADVEANQQLVQEQLKLKNQEAKKPGTADKNDRTARAPAPALSVSGGTPDQKGDKPNQTDKPEKTPLEQLGQRDFGKEANEIRQARQGNKEKPAQVNSLSQGVQAKGLKDILSDADDLMKKQRFTSALEQYDMAELVAPNNPMVALGRAHAELGAAYYSRADAHLHEALTANPALLMAQYDLKTFIGDERLGFLIKDLKELATKDQKSPRPAFLLAYIAYNTANERTASSYLDLADKRAGGADPLIKSLREHWDLPEPDKTPEKAPEKTPENK